MTQRTAKQTPASAAKSPSRRSATRARSGDAQKPLAVRTADAIQRRILEERLEPNTLIGSEAQLLQEYQVSRAVLREAILLLEQRQIATRRRGVGGGVLTRKPNTSDVARAVALYLEYSGINVNDLLDARITLESHCARLAADKNNRRKVAALRASLVEGAAMSGEAALQRMGGFHIQLAQLSGNPVWALFIEVLIDVAVAFTRRAGGSPSNEAMARQFKSLIAVVDAIAAGEGDKAGKLVSAYVEEVTRLYSS
ncbi:MAG: FadR/GntR family transcriptional regulator [Hyphomonadaceae bacterium]